MNEKQRAIVESFGRGLAVVAGAGCGKTTTLVAKCAELLRQNPKARFCAVSFTEKSVRDLKESLTEKLGGIDLQHHWVKTIHGLCASILQEFPVSAGLQGGERILVEDEANRLWNRSLEVLWSSNDNSGISDALDRLLAVYSRTLLEGLFQKLRNLMSFGVDGFISKSFDRTEVRDLWLVFESVYRRYQQAKNRDAGLDFNDLEVHADRALRDERVRAHFHSRFDLVLVDEFQDTNPLQGRILESLVRPGLSNLCIVGDPKQSIYRFRDADVSVFEDLTARLSARHVLDENYRSRPPIIGFVNQVCAPAFEASGLRYEPLIARKDDSGQDAVGILEWSEERDLAEFLLSERERGIDLSEFVILARSVRNSKTQKFIQALEARGIPILLGSGGRFYEDPRVLEVIAFLKGWVSPENTIAQVTALRAPWIGVSDTWLLEKKGAYFKNFFSEVDHPVSRALKDLYLSPGRMSRHRPGRILAELLGARGLSEEMYAPLVALWHKVEEWSRQGLRFEAVVGQLLDAVESGKIEKEIPAPAEKGMVRVMTVHGSKGLQFPRVILLDFEGPSRSSSRSGDLIWNRKLGVHLLNRDEDGAPLAEDSTNLEWKEIEKKAAIAESKRVFYVALTRAQECLILAWKKDVKDSKKSQEPGYDPYLEDNWRGWVKAGGIPKQIVVERRASPSEFGEGSSDRGMEGSDRDEVDSNQGGAAPPAEEGASESREGVVDPREALPADTESISLGASGAKPISADDKLIQKKQAVADFDPRPYRARHSPSEWLILNQCLRRYRNRVSEEPAHEDPLSEDLGIKAKERTEDRSTSGMTRTALAEKGERIHKFIEENRDQELIQEFSSAERGKEFVSMLRGFLRESNGTIRSYPELAFEVPLSGREALVGMMDRLEVDPEAKTIRVIDYKFTSKPETPEKLLSQYALQLRLYAYAASKLVSFTPEKTEGYLVHFTEGSLSIIPAPEHWFQPEALQAEVSKLFARAKSKDSEPRPGEYCQYCEIRGSCPNPSR